MRAEFCGVNIISSVRENGTTKHIYVCTGCEAEKITSDSSLTRWYKSGTKLCPACRGTSKGMTPEEKVNEFNASLTEVYKPKITMTDFVPTKSKRSSCILKFLECGHKKEYKTDTVKQMMKLGKALKCDVCGTSTSAQEKWAGELLPYKEQVKFSSLFECDRAWIADFVVDNLIIEVTTESKLAKIDYLTNIQEKTLFAAKNGYSLVVVTSLNNIKDIVRSLSKDKEH